MSSKCDYFKEKILIPLLIGIPALTMSIISLCSDCNQNKKYEKMLYLQNASTNPPILKIVNAKESLLIEPNLDTAVSLPEKSGIEFKFDITIQGELLLYNIGNSKAHYIGIAALDSFTTEPVLREKLLNPKDRFRPSDFKETTNFYKYKTILPNDTLAIPFNKSIRYFSQDSIQVLHVLILYQNDMKALFDTYFWICLESKKLEGLLYPEYTNYGKMYVAAIAKKDLATFKEENIDPYVYTMDEKNSIFKWYSSIKDEIPYLKK